MIEEYIHDYRLLPDFQTASALRRLHYEHIWSINQADEYISEFRVRDYEDHETITRIRFMLKQNVFEWKNLATRNIIERLGARLKDLPCQDWIIKGRTQTVREL